MFLVTLFLFFLLDVPFSKTDFPGRRLSINHPNFREGFRPEEGLLEIFLSPMSMAPNDHAMLDNIFDPDFKADAMNYELFTKNNKEQGVTLSVDDAARLRDSPFNSTWPIKIIIHGWTDSGNAFWVHDIRRNYLSVGDYNVICVNWFAGSSREYLTAVRLTRQVGEYVAAFLEFLSSEGQISLDDVHVLGHSLGAHVAGYAGSYVPRKLARITGLDPAGPAFETPYLKDPGDRLDSTDANFVDVIHTCAGSLGFLRPIGHVDFYPNGGTFTQPGCPIFSSQYCSHGRAHQFFAESIVRPDGFVALQCGSWTDLQLGRCNTSVAFMGESVSTDARGTFYLETNAQPPFGKGAA